jgi:hypothetical protein
MADPTGAACDECGQMVTTEPGLGGSLAFTHVTPPEDGHDAVLGPVTVTYASEGVWTDVSCDELGGPLGSVIGLDVARNLAAGCLRRLQPPRGVRERYVRAGG